MKDKTILTVSFTVAFVGIVVLALISKQIEEPEVVINRIDDVNFENVKVKGYVEDISERGSITVVKIMEPTYVEGVVFDDIDGLEKGDYISVTGEIQEYQGKKNLVIDSIKS